MISGSRSSASQASWAGVGGADLGARQAGIGLDPQGGERLARGPCLALSLEREPPRRVITHAFLRVAVSKQVDHSHLFQQSPKRLSRWR